MRRVTLPFVLATALAWSAGAAAQGVLVEEGFDHGLPAGWLRFDASLNVPNGFPATTLQVVNGVMDLGYGCVILPGRYVRNAGLRIEADVNITWPAAGDFNVFVFFDPADGDVWGCNHATNGYEFGIYPIGSDNPNDLILVARNGTFRRHTLGPNRLFGGQWHHVVIEVGANRDLRSLVDGVDGVFLRDGRFDEGPILLRSWGHVLIDNVRVSTMARNVGIDIEPRDPLNTIRRRGIRVVIFSAAGFDAVTDIDQSTLTFGKTGDEHSLHRCASRGRGRDYNGDGLADLYCTFKRKRTGLAQADMRAILKGRTTAGAAFVGEDLVLVGR